MFPDYARLAEAVFNSRPDDIVALRAICDRTDALREQVGEDDPRVQAGEHQANELKGMFTRRIAWACAQQDPRIGLRRKESGQHATRGDGVAHSTDALMLRDTGQICDVMSDRNWSWNANPADTQPLDQWLAAQPEPGDVPVPVDVKDRAFVLAGLTALYATLGVRPTGSGTGATDIAYYADKVIETGGWTSNTERNENNIGYWSGRIKSDLEKQGTPLPGPGPSLPPPAPSEDLKPRLAALEELVAHQGAQLESQRQRLELYQALEQRVKDLEDRPAPALELPELVAEGNTGRIYGHAHPVTLKVRKA